MKFAQSIVEERLETFPSPLESLQNSLISALFQVNFAHSGSIVPPRLNSYVRTWPQLAVTVVQAVQVLGVVLVYVQECYGYREVEYLVWGLEMVRPELVVWRYTSEQTSFYFFLCIVSTCGLVSGLELICTALHSRPLPASFHLLSNSLMSIFYRVLYLPSVLIFLTVLRDSNQFSERLLPLISLFLTLLLSLYRVLFLSTNNWHIRSFQLFSMSNSDFEVQEILCLLLISILHTGVLSISLILNAAVTVMVLWYLCVQIVWKVPYFNRGMSVMKTGEYAVAGWMGVSVEVGLLCDSALVTVGLFVVCAPCVAVLAVYAFHKRLKRISSCEASLTFPEFELSLRKSLTKHSQNKLSPSSLKLLLSTGVTRFKSTKLVHLLFSQYYFYLRDEPEYALLRLACAHECASSLFLDYQIYHFFEKVSELSNSEERGYLDYVKYYRNAVKSDWVLCRQIWNVFNRLKKPGRNVKLLEGHFSRLSTAINLTNETYLTAIHRFPLDQLLRKNHNLLHSELFFHPSIDLIHTSNPKFMNINRIEAYTGTDVGVFVISCHKEKFAKIVFANKRCAEILECQVEEIEGRDLDDFLPPPLAIGHNTVMAHFIQAGEAKEVFRSHLFLYAHSKYSVEVTFRFRPSAFHGVPYFVVAIRSKATSREFVLFDNGYTVTSHSKYFHKIIGVQL